MQVKNQDVSSNSLQWQVHQTNHGMNSCNTSQKNTAKYSISSLKTTTFVLAGGQVQSRCISNIPRIAVALAVSLMLALMPFTVNLQTYRISLERNEAHAIAPVFAGAAAFITEMATAAGFASAGEFIATVAGISAAGAGMGIATEAGINFGNTATQNLEALVDTADYPDWSTLTETEQSNWGSRDNYDSAKFNSLMAAYGMGDDYDRYISTWGNFTPGEFQFSTSANDNLEQIGDIGSNWISGAGNTFEDIKRTLTNKAALYSALGSIGSSQLDMSNVEGWNSSVPTDLSISETSYAFVNYGTWREVWFSKPVTVCVFRKDNYDLRFFAWSESPFTYSTDNWSSSTNADSYTGYYEKDLGYANVREIQSTNVTINNVTFSNSVYNWFRSTGIPLIMGLGDTMQYETNVIGYPENPLSISKDTYIYFPIEGIDSTVPWEDFLSGQQHELDKIDQIIALLQHIDGDLHDMGGSSGSTDLTPLINLLQTIDGHIQNLDYVTISDLQPYYTLLQHIDSDLHKLQFYNSGELKVHDEGVFTELSDIYTLLMSMDAKMKNWGDITDAPDLIGDFDFDEFENKVPDLLETISDLAPFGSILLLSEMYSILANYTQIESPELIFPFDFGGFDEQNHELVIDLSWLDDIKPLVNFFCIAMLVIAISNATIRIVEIEAAS